MTNVLTKFGDDPSNSMAARLLTNKLTNKLTNAGKNITSSNSVGGGNNNNNNNNNTLFYSLFILKYTYIQKKPIEDITLLWQGSLELQ